MTFDELVCYLKLLGFNLVKANYGVYGTCIVYDKRVVVSTSIRRACIFGDSTHLISDYKDVLEIIERDLAWHLEQNSVLKAKDDEERARRNELLMRWQRRAERVEKIRQRRLKRALIASAKLST